MSLPACRVFLLAPNWLGDLVMSTPLLTWLRSQSPLPDGRKLEIVLGVRRAWAPLFQEDPRLDGLLVLERRGRDAGMRGAFRQAGRVRRERFAGVLIGPPSLRAGLTSWLSRIPIRVGYRCDGRGPLLTRSLPLPPRGCMHFSGEMMALGEALLEELTGGQGFRGGELVPRINLPIRKDPGAITGCGQYWVVAPGTTYGEAKTWPAGRVAEFLELAVAGRGVSVVLLGDAQAEGFVAQMRENSRLPWLSEPGAQPAVINLVGRTNLIQAATLLQGAAAFVGNDSGLMHLAGALGIPTVGIFGSSSPLWTAPLGPLTRVVAVQGFPCHPCFQKSCDKDVFCLTTVTPQAVLAVLEELLGCLDRDQKR